MSVIIYKNGKFVGNPMILKQMTGEKIPGDLRKWDYFDTDPNALLLYSYDILSQRSTTLYHTHPPLSAAINKTTTYGVGPGLVFRSQPDWKTLGVSKEQAKEWGLQFQKLIHYAFLLLNFYQKQNILFKTSLIMGDSLLIFDRQYQENGLPFDLIEFGGDQIDYSRTDSSHTLGIRHDKYYRRKGVALENGENILFKDSLGDQNIIQFYIKHMARQLRGYPLAYKIIAAAKNNDRWWDATLARAVLESIMFGVAQTDNENPALQAQRMAAQLKNESNMNVNSSNITTEANVANLGVGNIFSLKTGSDLKFTDLKTPSDNFDKMQNAYIEVCGMATEVPPEVIMSKYGTSFTAHKGALNDFKTSYTEKRGIFTKTVCQPVVLELAKYFIMSGMIEPLTPDFFDNAITQMATISGNYLGPVPGHINPSVEVQAKITAIENGLMLRSDGAAEYGNEFENMIEEWHAEEEAYRGKNSDKQLELLADDLQKKDDDGEFENEDDKKDQEDDE